MSNPEKAVRVRVAGVLIEDDKVLLISHKKNDKVYWLLPGGGVNFGESLEEALKREFFEELRVVIDVHSLALVCDSIDPSGDRHIINICFYCSYSEGEYIIGDEERLYDYCFFNEEDLSDIVIYPPMNEEIKSALNNKINEIYIGKIWMEK